MNALKQLREDVFHRLRSEAVLADAVILDARPRDEGEAAQIMATIQGALAGMQAGPTGKAGLAILVLPPDGEVPNPDSPGPQLELVIQVRVFENVLINDGDGGTQMEGEACALHVLNTLHLFNRSGQTLYADKRAIREVDDEEQNLGGYAWDIVFRQPVSCGKTIRTAPPTITLAESLAVLTSEDGAAIYYTTDGSAPAPSNAAATLYAAPFEAELGSSIRAAAFKEGKAGSNITQRAVP